MEQLSLHDTKLLFQHHKLNFCHRKYYLAMGIESIS